MSPGVHFASSVLLFPSAFSVQRFNYAAPVLWGYFVLAVATGILAGALLRRSLPAMVATLAVFLPIRLAVEFWLRPRYMTPATAIDPVPGSGAVTQQISQGDTWVLDNYLVGPPGSTPTAPRGTTNLILRLRPCRGSPPASDIVSPWIRPAPCRCSSGTSAPSRDPQSPGS